MVKFLRKLRHALCLLRGGHMHYWPVPHGDAMIANCSRCGHVSVLDLSDLPKPVRYTGISRKRRVSS